MRLIHLAPSAGLNSVCVPSWPYGRLGSYMLYYTPLVVVNRVSSERIGWTTTTTPSFPVNISFPFIWHQKIHASLPSIRHNVHSYPCIHHVIRGASPLPSPRCRHTSQCFPGSLKGPFSTSAHKSALELVPPKPKEETPAHISRRAEQVSSSSRLKRLGGFGRFGKKVWEGHASWGGISRILHPWLYGHVYFTQYILLYNGNCKHIHSVKVSRQLEFYLFFLPVESNVLSNKKSHKIHADFMQSAGGLKMVSWSYEFPHPRTHHPPDLTLPVFTCAMSHW